MMWCGLTHVFTSLLVAGTVVLICNVGRDQDVHTSTPVATPDPGTSGSTYLHFHASDACITCTFHFTDWDPMLDTLVVAQLEAIVPSYSPTDVPFWKRWFIKLNSRTKRNEVLLQKVTNHVRDRRVTCESDETCTHPQGVTHETYVQPDTFQVIERRWQKTTHTLTSRAGVAWILGTLVSIALAWCAIQWKNIPPNRILRSTAIRLRLQATYLRDIVWTLLLWCWMTLLYLVALRAVTVGSHSTLLLAPYPPLAGPHPTWIEIPSLSWSSFWGVQALVHSLVWICLISGIVFLLYYDKDADYCTCDNVREPVVYESVSSTDPGVFPPQYESYDDHVSIEHMFDGDDDAAPPEYTIQDVEALPLEGDVDPMDPMDPIDTKRKKKKKKRKRKRKPRQRNGRPPRPSRSSGSGDCPCDNFWFWMWMSNSEPCPSSGGHHHTENPCAALIGTILAMILLLVLAMVLTACALGLVILLRGMGLKLRARGRARHVRAFTKQCIYIE